MNVREFPGYRPVDQLMAELLPEARQLLGMEVAFVSEFKEGRRVFRHVAAGEGFQPVAVGASDPLDESYCQRVVDGRLPELIPDAAQLPEAAALAVTRALPVGAHLSVPIRFDSGRVYGTFCCFSRRPDTTLGSRDLAMMRFFARVMGKVLEEQEAEAAQRRALAVRVRAVLDERRYAIAFQPIVDLADSRVVGFEALARFQSQPQRPPNEWLEDAARAGLLQDMERAVHREALGRLGTLPGDAYLALNVTPATLLGGALAASLEGAPPERVVLEITEHESVDDYERLALALAPLRAQGLRLAVDDVGAGYANFRHILKLRPDIIKLDRSLIQDIDTQLACRSLAVALVQFSREFGCRVVAEGVETPEELAVLREIGVRYAQGYLLGRPQVPGSEGEQGGGPTTGGGEGAWSR